MSRWIRATNEPARISCFRGEVPSAKFRVRAALFDNTVWGALIPPHTSRALGSEIRAHARVGDSRAALGNPQDKKHARQIYSGRSFRDATRPDSQAASPHLFNLHERLSFPIQDWVDRHLRPIYPRWKVAVAEAQMSPFKRKANYVDDVPRW